MRFTVIVRADQDSEADVMPNEQLLLAMGKYNDDLVAAGVLLASEGCTPAPRAHASGSRATSAQ